MPTEREQEESLKDKRGSSHYLKSKIEVMVKLSGDKWEIELFKVRGKR